MRYQMVTVQILVESVDYGETCDAIAETLRPTLKEFKPDSPIIDWRYAPNGDPEPHDGTGFEYAT